MLISKPGTGSTVQPVAWLADDVLLATLPGPGSCRRPDMAAVDVFSQLDLPGFAQPPVGTVRLGGPKPFRVAAFRVAPGEGPADLAPRPGPDTMFDLLATEATSSGRDPLALAGLLDAEGRRRLLEFLLGFCRAAFRLSRDADFAALCHEVAALCCVPAGEATPFAEVLPGRILLAGPVLQPGDTLYLVGPDSARLATSVVAGGPDVALLLIDRPEPDERLLALGAQMRTWAIAPCVDVPDVRSLTGPELEAARAICRRAFFPAAPGSAEAAVLQDLPLPAPAAAAAAPAAPGALELAVADGDGAWFLSGWLRDPRAGIVGADLVSAAGSRPVAPELLHRIVQPAMWARPSPAGPSAAGHTGPGPPGRGFVARVPQPKDTDDAAGPPPALRLRLTSGSTVALTAPDRRLPPAAARDTVLSCVLPHEAVGRIMAECLAPTAASLHRQSALLRGNEAVIRIGRQQRRPAVSVLVPLYRVLGFLRFQLAAFAEDPDCRAGEIIYALDSPEQAAQVEHMLRGLQHMHDLSVSLVVMERNAGFAATTNAAARHAAGRALLLLNSDVVPVRPGWLAALTQARALTGAVAATARLLFEDGSLQHAGLYFARDSQGSWFNNHYHKGLPRDWPEAVRRRRVPAGTGAALLIDRARFEAVGGVCEDYIIGDYEDSDLCLRLRQAGGDIVYEPRAELYHFERRSISLHPGYTRTVACQYNRFLHQQRWDAAMAALMAEPQFRADLPPLRCAA